MNFSRILEIYIKKRKTMSAKVFKVSKEGWIKVGFLQRLYWIVKYGTQPLVLELFTTKNVVGPITFAEFSRYNVWCTGGCVICDKVSISSWESDGAKQGQVITTQEKEEQHWEPNRMLRAECEPLLFQNFTLSWNRELSVFVSHGRQQALLFLVLSTKECTPQEASNFN